MYRCFLQSQLRVFASLCLAAVTLGSAAAQDNRAAQLAATAQQNDQSAPSAASAQPAATPSQRPTDSEVMGKIDFSKSRKSFPNMLAPYEGRTLRSPRLSNSARINQLIKDGKLVLSLNDAVALALENNLDLAIARYNLDIADTDVLRTKAGASVRGVASGLVQGTPGGGIGGFGSGAPGAGAGGTSGGAGGAGTGASGLVQSTLGTGTAVSSYDPAVTASIGAEHQTTPLANLKIYGVPSLQLNTGQTTFGYLQAFATGTSVSFQF